MSFSKFALFCILNANILGNNLVVDDDFFIIEKKGVSYKFIKTRDETVDKFTSEYFKGWEEDTFDVFEQVKDKEGIAIDIGAWIGTTAIWLSKNFHHVVAIEADKESLSVLRKNLQASVCDNVSICPNAISDVNGAVFFGPRLCMSDSLNYSTSYAKSESNSKHDSETPSITFSQLVNDYVNSNNDLKGKKITFIKCDIEGGEEKILKEVLTYAKENKCKVWMSFHYNWWNNKNILEYKEQLEAFHAFCSKGDVCLFIQENPFGSVLLVPKS